MVIELSLSAEKYSLRESMALIKMCDYAVASDSGLGHLAAVIGIPTISFFWCWN